MIYLLDEICVDAAAAGHVAALYERDYVPGAVERGMQLLDRWAGPPVALYSGTRRLYWRWGISDARGFWAMREAACADASVVAFWNDFDTHIGVRHRQVLCAVEALSAAPQPTRRALLELGARATGQVRFAGGLNDSHRRSWLAAMTGLSATDSRVDASVVAPNLEDGDGGGDYTWDMVFTTAAARDSWFEERWADTLAAHCDLLDIAAWTSMRAECAELAVCAPIKRTQAVRVRSTVAPQALVQFEQELAAMSDYIGAIRNWCLARVDYQYGNAGWSYLWQQEFDDLAGLHDDYMTSPYHWGFVDRWFDPEMPEHVVEKAASAFCRYPESVLCER